VAAVVGDSDTFFMPGLHDRENHLLAQLPPAERERIDPHLQLVPMPLGKVLYESGGVQSHVYFPIDCIVSLLYVMADGASAEISVVGHEGIIGVSLFMGGETNPMRAVVQSAGSAYKLGSRQLKEEFHRNDEMQQLLLRYTQALLTQMAQTAVCNRPSLAGPAAMPLAAAVAGPAAFQSPDHDAGAHRQYARCAP
jgi:CRP-like cAMP-binding protein